MHPSRTVPRGVAALSCALALWSALWGAGCDAGSASDAPPPQLDTVEAMRIGPDELVDVAVFSGQLDAEHSVVVKPEIEGVIESIGFEQGQPVREGDVLFALHSREQAAKLREARANRDLARLRWDRARKLVRRDASSQASADVAQAELEVAEARVDMARVQLDRTRIRAPFAGVVGQRLVDIGDRVDEDSLLVRIDAVDRLQLSFGISDEGLPFARPGMKVQAWVRPYPREKFSGEVFFVSPTLDPRNRRILVKAWIENPEHRLAPGLFANVDLEVRRVQAAIVVPESAVALDRRGPHVWKLDDENRASRVPIEIGLRERGLVEVLRGLSPGARIVTAGTHKVSEGEQLKVSETPLIGRAPSTPPEGALIGEGT